jgi:hypothetical protein
MQQGRLPCDAPQLPWLLQLMQLAVMARTSLREAQYNMPPPPTRELHTVRLKAQAAAILQAVPCSI